MSSDEVVEQLFEGPGTEGTLPEADSQGNDQAQQSSNDADESSEGREESVEAREPVTAEEARQSIVDVMPKAIDWPYQGVDPTCVQCKVKYDIDDRRVCPCEQTYCEYCLETLSHWMVLYNTPMPVYHCGRPLPTSPCDCEVCCTNSDDEGTYCVICRMPEHCWMDPVPELVFDGPRKRKSSE